MIGTSLSLGVGINNVPEALVNFPQFIQTLFSTPSVVVSTIIIVFLNAIIPNIKDDDSTDNNSDEIVDNLESIDGSNGNKTI